MSKWTNGLPEIDQLTKDEGKFVQFLLDAGYSILRYRYNYSDVVFDIEKNGKHLEFRVVHDVKFNKQLCNWFFDCFTSVSKEEQAMKKSGSFIDEVLRYLKESSGRTYSYRDFPDWAQPIVIAEFGENQLFTDFYDLGGCISVTYREGGDYITNRIYKNGTITER